MTTAVGRNLGLSQLEVDRVIAIVMELAHQMSAPRGGSEADFGEYGLPLAFGVGCCVVAALRDGGVPNAIGGLH
ncbi:hypothetical protein UFOVP73_39 [uncultured Caudovirales phage]|uniref:Uncharacterized protein n=1 Tax=uncultured Caudovirales phage TaxID=2100421 RepID=A0A6J5KUP9_9CAUD|nr:hypothetical protein UFOVP73_39 [uncultured Caudovirales phage]CAB5195184.1 hypothetical protein UFOVP170_61 [uncultured Caudovirales phage]